MRARVVVPHWRGPWMSVTGVSAIASVTTASAKPARRADLFIGGSSAACLSGLHHSLSPPGQSLARRLVRQ